GVWAGGVDGVAAVTEKRGEVSLWLRWMGLKIVAPRVPRGANLFVQSASKNESEGLPVWKPGPHTSSRRMCLVLDVLECGAAAPRWLFWFPLPASTSIQKSKAAKHRRTPKHPKPDRTKGHLHQGSDRDHDLADLLVRLQVAVGLNDLVER